MIIEKIEKWLLIIAFSGLLLVGISLLTDTVIPGAIGFPVGFIAGIAFWIVEVFTAAPKEEDT